MSSGHQKPLCSSEAWVSFLASLAVSNGRVQLWQSYSFWDTAELSFIECFHRDHSSKYQKITGGMVVFVFD